MASNGKVLGIIMDWTVCHLAKIELEFGKVIIVSNLSRYDVTRLWSLASAFGFRTSSALNQQISTGASNQHCISLGPFVTETRRGLSSVRFNYIVKLIPEFVRDFGFGKRGYPGAAQEAILRKCSGLVPFRICRNTLRN